MKILYDYQIFYLQKYGGISNYFVSLINNLVQLNHNCKIIAPIHVSETLSSIKRNIVEGININKKNKLTSSIYRLINEFFFEYRSVKFKPDLVHHTYYNKRFHFYNTKRVSTVYDLIHENYYNQINVKKKAIDFSDHLICISKNTQKELIDYYNVDEKKTSVVYLASKFKINENEILKKNIIEPYLLFVGDRFKYKNFKRFIKSISSSKLLKNNIKIVCFGVYPFTKDELNYINSENLDLKKISYISGDDQMLKNLYLNSVALVYPSLYEGFGLPIIEAMSLGCPVACSNSSSMQEVGGNAVNYFDPTNIDEMKNSIEQIVFSSEKRNLLDNLGFEQNKKFSWKKCADETLNVYKKIL